MWVDEMKGFTDEIDEYVVLTLDLGDFNDSNRTLSGGYEFVDAEGDRTRFRQTEKALLHRYFKAWYKPYLGRLPGFRPDSAVFVTRDDRLVAGVYLCDSNEFRWKGWGQLHYAFIDPEHRGKGIYSAVFRSAVERAKVWGLDGLVLNSDRYMLPDVYLRWGAKPFITVRKGPIRKLLSTLWSKLMEVAVS